MRMTTELVNQLHVYKVHKKRAECEKEILFEMLPDEVQDELHYNGPERAKERYPEYAKIFEQFRRD